MSAKLITDAAGFQPRLNEVLADSFGGNISKMARSSGVSRRKVNDMVHGHSLPKQRSITVAIAKASGVHEHWLTSGESPKFDISYHSSGSGSDGAQQRKAVIMNATKDALELNDSLELRLNHEGVARLAVLLVEYYLSCEKAEERPSQAKIYDFAKEVAKMMQAG